ncbi:transporter associated domain-containing protein [Peptoniphilus catoniae]|uniref:transporter associated domain-containing protein n=1 Tax=Peptoniphilus catoniae TaxID=1660341 RepID=UPI0010FE947C|nr:transporter associated domain-containing protein [Peptoniphilus catoniae]
MNRKKFMLYLSKLIYLFEILISLMLIIGILISIPDIIKYYIKILQNDVKVSGALFSDFLSHVLMLVIAMEFIMLMVAQTDTTIVHLITLVIARKMLIKSDEMSDILLGVISITILFITRKFLSKSQGGVESLALGEDVIFSAVSRIKEINMQYNYKIDPKGCETIGGLVVKLLEENGEEIEENKMIEDENYIYEVYKYNNGLIEEVSITNKNT